MKKRLLSLFLALVMICSLLPAEILAAETNTETVIYTGTDFPYSMYYVSNLTLSGAKVDYVEGLNVYLNHTTPKDAEITFTVTAGGRLSGNLGINWNDESENTKTYTTKLVDGEATVKIYAYKASGAGVSRSGTKTFNIHTAEPNNLPVLADGVDAEINKTITAGETYSVALDEIFYDADGDELEYYISLNGAETTKTDGQYKFSTKVAGEYNLRFTVSDGKGECDVTYSVKLTVKNSAETNSMTVYVPDGLTPCFYITSGFEDGIDKLGEIAESIKGTSSDGMTAYTVNYPVNAEMLSIRTEDFGGMAFNAEKDGVVSFRKVQLKAVDYNNNDADSTNEITYSGNIAIAGSDGWLLQVDNEYVFAVTPENAVLAPVSKSFTIEAGADVFDVSITLGIKNPLSITVPDGAKAQLYKYNKYYDNTELKAEIISENDDDTTTYQFVADTKANGAFYIYRVSMDGKITKAGWVKWGQQDITVTYTENDKEPSYRLDDYSQTGANNSGFTEDSVLLNVNRQNHLSMNVGDTKTLKAYRAWEIIPVSYNNYILTPDFHFNILSGEDVISLTEKASPSTADGDWMTVTALREGTAVIEVTYDAMEVTGGSYDGIYGASDPARTGLIVVTVGGETPAVDFSIKGKASQGSVVYEKSTPKAWDAEFDTLYFTGKNGEIKLTPTVTDDAITEVAVSNDKGANWTVLTSNEGEYIAKITSGNNIIRVTTEKGVAYQIVRGDKVTVRMYNETNKGQPFAAGDTVRVYIDGLHSPIPKMAGNYNPGYGGNTDGYSSQHMSFMLNGSRVQGAGAQYNFITAANYIDIVIPENTEETSFNLTDGYIGVGIIGLTQFADGGDSHRNIPDGGCGTRGSSTTFNTRSMLPDITVEIGGIPTGNTAPYVREKAPETASVTLGKTYAVNLPTVFEDRENDELTYKVSIDGAEAAETEGYFTYTPESEGEYELTFTASDGEFEATHTIILTVKPALPQNPAGGLDFGLSADEIDGYVYISFTDNGERVEGESGVTYPEPLGTIISRTKVPYIEGDTIADATLRLLYAKDMTASYSGSTKSGFYLGAIGNFTVDGIDYDSFGEFDAGVGSGWMITHNDVFIEYGASEFEVADGDIVKWQYTCQLGADIGDPYYDGMGGAVTPVKNAIDMVEELIAAIGEVTLDSKSAIEEARTAYDALNDSQKKLVENYDDLLNAESRYEALLKAEKLPFTDVENHWGIEAITYVYENNIMTGTGDTTFEPDAVLSRGMLATVLYRLAGSPEVTAENPFPDVKADEWYTDAVIWAYENKIVKGYDNGNFGPMDNITREQFALMLMNYAQFKGIDTSAKNDLSQFVDADDTSLWALNAMQWAVAEGYITGRDTGLAPGMTANRAETAKILMRFMENK